MPTKRNRKKKSREHLRDALKKHLRKFKKKRSFNEELEREIWKCAKGSTLAYARICRRVVKHYKGQRLAAKTVAARTTLQWLNKKERKRWKALRLAKIEKKQATLLQFADNKSLLQCSRCKEFKVTYYQRQTRSADEPMSVFATCHACGKKWKQ